MAINWVVGTDVGNPLNLIAFSAILHRRSRARQWWLKKNLVRNHEGNESPFDRDKRAPVVRVEKLGRDGAQQVRIPMLLPLQRSMRSEGTTWEGSADTYDDYTRGVANMVDSEERIRTLNTTVWTQNVQHATGMYNPALQDLRTAFKMSLQVTDLLAEWFANADEELYNDAMYDRYGVHITASSLASTAPHPNLLAPAGVANLESMGDGGAMSCSYLRAIRTWIEATGFLNPIDVDGQSCYGLLLHTYCFEDLWRDPEFQTSMQQAMPRGKDNPVFQYADAFYAGFYIFNYSRVRTVDTSITAYNRIRMNMLLGADALAVAETTRPQIVTRQEYQYGNVAGWAIKSIRGQARFDFRDESSANPINQSSAIVHAYTSSAGNISVL